MSSRFISRPYLWPEASRAQCRAERTPPAARNLRLFGRRHFLHLDVEREFAYAQVLVDRRRNGLDLDQLGLREPGRGLDVAHQRRHAGIRLRVADQRDLRADLLHRPQVDPVRQLPHHLVEKVHRFGAVRLQRLDDLLAG
jgi:hypothetical protein